MWIIKCGEDKYGYNYFEKLETIRGLGTFPMVTDKIEKAKLFRTKKEAESYKQNHLRKHYEVERVEQK